jgi:DNA-binding phage protein
MPDTLPTVRGDEAAERYNWLEAARLYADSFAQDKTLSVSDIERSGSCLVNAAFQARHCDDFQMRLSDAIAFYQRFATQFETHSRMRQKEREGEGDRDSAKSSYLLAKAVLLKSWLTKDIEERKKLILHSINLAERSLRKFLSQDARDCSDIGIFYNHLLSCFCELLASETNGDSIRALIEKSIGYWETSIEMLSRIGFEKELCEMYFIGYNLFTFQSVASLSSKIRELSSNKASECSRKIRQIVLHKKELKLLVRETGNLYALVSQDDGKDSFRQIQEICDELLPRARDSGDSLLICTLLRGLISTAAWSLGLAEDNPEARVKLLLQIRQNFNELISLYDIVTPIGLHTLFLPTSFTDIINSELEVAHSEPNVETKNVLADRVLDLCESALKRFQDNPNEMVIEAATANSYIFRASLERDRGTKIKFLYQARVRVKRRLELLSRISPQHYWDFGAGYCQLASVCYEISNLVESREDRIDLIEQALQASSSGLDLIQKHKPEEAFGLKALVRIAMWLEEQGSMLETLSKLDKDRKYEALKRKLSNLELAADTYIRADLPSRVAETYWELGNTDSLLYEDLRASDCCEKASRYFKDASRKILALKEYFQDYSVYMSAWSLALKARHNHNVEDDHLAAASYFSRAADLLAESSSWSPISYYLQTCARMEHLEGLFAADQDREKEKQFLLEISDDFWKCQQSFEILCTGAEDTQKSTIFESFAFLSSLRRRYCDAAARLAEAVEHYSQGNLKGCINSFEQVIGSLSKIAQVQRSDWERQEVEALISSCRGWEIMCQADEKSSPQIYEDAAVEFLKSSRKTLKAESALIARGNANYCLGIASGLRFIKEWNTNHLEAAKSYLYSAFDAYAESGKSSEAKAIIATERVLDSFGQIRLTLLANNDEDRAKNRFAAAKTLENAQILFEKSGQHTKSEKLGPIIDKIRQDEELSSLRLEEIFSLQVISSANIAKNLATPLFGGAIVEGLSEFQGPNVQMVAIYANNVIPKKTFEFRLDFYNIGKQAAILHKLKSSLPVGMELVQKLEHLDIERQRREVDGKTVDVLVELNGRRLEPFQTTAITFLARVNDIGEFEVHFVLYYSDLSGGRTSTLTSRTKIDAKPDLRFDDERMSAFFEALVEAFIDDRVRRKIRSEIAGERTLSQIAKQAGVSASALYQHRKVGLASIFGELVFRGLVEKRVYEGERGRGGEVVRYRIAYEKSPLKEYLDERIGSLGRA